ncbi:MAG: WYL domain-containing protein [Balneola sp.]|nr:MAG: WYL domain-containing protein [Balneola sp.]
MPVNRNALIRYRTIDNCLRNRQRLWTLEDLIERCSEALYEYEGIDKGVSRRTVQSDIQIMRSDKLGYNAPIIVERKKYYSYSDPEYTITNIPLTEQDIGTLNEVVEILKQFKGFSHFEDMDGMIKKLENKVYRSQPNSRSIIDFEKNEGLRGLHHLDDLYQAILNKSVLAITYQSFRARKANELEFHPQFLKEYRNRWFVVGGKSRDAHPLNLALDRIQEIKVLEDKKYLSLNLNPQDFYRHVIGVTTSPNMRPREVMIFVDRGNAPYVLTKPLHHSQQLVRKVKDGIIISIHVQFNFELEREILGFGESMKVLSPPGLAKRISNKLYLARRNYEDSSYPIESEF